MTIKFTSFMAAVLVVFATSAHAADPISTGRLSNLAVGGYDSVSYFVDGAPMKGSSEFSTEYMGAEWRFTTAENLARFKADPEAYAPQYGGYCAWAAAGGKTASGNPRQWAIVDGKLYLNYNKKVKGLWDEDRAGFIAQADERWPELLK